ncbi:hypothetical protein RCO48_38675 [Peribacillus frigoritolerans]|nr:hypothetical protein [Peribacillus frigoritolerans]
MTYSAQQKKIGDNVIVFDFGGDWPGMEAAIYLAEKRPPRHPHIITPAHRRNRSPISQERIPKKNYTT